MFALLAYIAATLFALCIQARDIRTQKAEALGMNAQVLGADLSILLAEALLEEYGTGY